MGYCLPVWHEKIDVEHWMDTPLRGKFEAIIDRGHHLDDLKRAVALRPEFGRRLGGTEVLALCSG